MKITRTITINDTDFAPLYGELSALSDHEMTDIDPQTQAGTVFMAKFPTVAKLMGILKSEAVKDQSTFNYERIG